jgi:ABC-2 type transport system permease protein
VKNLIRAELLKQRTTPAFLAAFAAVPVIAVLVILAVYGAAGRQGNDPLGPESLVHAVGAPASVITMLALLLGVVGMAGEFRHKTITTTLLAAPRRGEVVVAKVAAHAVTGAAMAAATIAVSLAVAVPWLIRADVPLTQGGEAAGVAAGLVVSTVLHAALGVAAGALLRNQTAAVGAVIAWVLKGEDLVAVLPGLKGIADWLPATLAEGLVRAGAGTPSPWVATAVLIAYVVGLAALGARLTLSRDVT